MRALTVPPMPLRDIRWMRFTLVVETRYSDVKTWALLAATPDRGRVVGGWNCQVSL
ncbi:hypothetical protein JY651_18430 [Pyxidicoccus parkwayensis]|uniref:Uncharacterized protein n=1 Tax=Pyxidicoccus parkwayensis TaxID=2813578 RepID=A0ABX7P8G5_9BACT|nr:hypothetical protein [Pyxidicoccus parkwaysis]QSQ26776.1 hypothetical protein JY651_18430 [Pyxidicoccus parkwaysis]